MHVVRFLLWLICLGVVPGRAAEEELVLKPGDRIAIVGNTFADQMRRYGYVEAALRQAVPEISLRNIGWAGDTVAVRARPTNFEPEDQTLAKHETDVILVCFGLGEALDGEATLPEFLEKLDALVTHYQGQAYNGETAPRVVLVSPIACVDLGPRTPAHARLRTSLGAFSAAMQSLADQKNWPFVDLFTPTQSWVAEDGLSDNGLHPNAKGYQRVADLIAQALVPGQAVELDAAQPVASGPANRVQAASGGLELELAESWIGHRRVVIHNLAPAYYTLSVDGKSAVTATHKQWAAGVDVVLTPSSDAQKLLAGIVDKNDQFVYGWKALNTVHIVGERRRSKSGQALPGEIEVFYRLVGERDGALPALHPPARSQAWRLLANPERKLP